MADNLKNIEEAANLLRKASDMLSGSTSSRGSTRNVHEAVHHARSMIQQSSRGGLYRRLNQTERLRATAATSQAKNKAKTERKPFEFCLLTADEDGDDYDEQSLLKENIVERGIVLLKEGDNEADIREKIVSSVKEKYPIMSGNDFEFVKVTQKKISIMNLAKGMEYNFPVLKKLVGQGLLYVRTRRGYQFVLERSNVEENDPDKDPAYQQHTYTATATAQSTATTTTHSTTATAQSTATTTAHSTTATTTTQSTAATTTQGTATTIIIQDDNKPNEAGESLPESITDPTEMLRYLQKKIVKGRDLEVTDPSQTLEGDTNYITVDRDNIMETTFDELKEIEDPSITFTVQFYGENAADRGGPRKEWIRLFNQETKKKYFDNGLKEHLAEDYFFIGQMAAIALLQNGQVPRYFPEKCLQDIFVSEDESSDCISQLKKGMDTLGIHKFGRKHPIFLHLLRPSTSRLTVPILIHLLQPSFAETGSNARMYENQVYSKFIKYVREVSSGRRVTTLPNILEFVTGASEEPLLGFAIKPSIKFPPVVCEEAERVRIYFKVSSI